VQLTPNAEGHIQIGDRFTDEEGEWEVVSRPATLHGAKTLGLSPAASTSAIYCGLNSPRRIDSPSHSP